MCWDFHSEQCDTLVHLCSTQLCEMGSLLNGNIRFPSSVARNI